MGNIFNKFSSRGSKKKGSVYHSSAYHKHFEGYVETRVPKANGRGEKIVRVYTGQYYSQDMPDKRWKLNRIKFLALYLGAGALFILGCFLGYSENRILYIELPEVLSFFGLFWMLYVLVNYMIAPRKMTVGVYRTTSRPLIISSRLTAAALELSALTLAIYELAKNISNPLYGLLGSASFVCAGAALFVLGAMESRIIYKTLPSENETNDDGILITR